MTTSNVAQTIQNALDVYYPEGPTDLEYLRFYANLAVRALFYAEGQGVLQDAVLAQLLRQSYAAAQKLAVEEKEETNVD